MAYVYGLVDSLQGTDMVGMAGAGDRKECVFLVQEQDSQYIYVMDQWTGKTTKVSTRPIARKGGMRSDGTYPDASNNAEAFYIIE